jgi:hypothetical protein
MPVDAMKAESTETPTEKLKAGIEPGPRMFHLAGLLEV